MSKVKSFIYYIEYKDGSNETMNKNTLESLVDNEFDIYITLLLFLI